MDSPIGERTTVATLLALTFTAGLVDAVCFLRLGHVFVANMTGNVVFLGLSVASAAGRPVLATCASLGCYMLGAMLGGQVWRRLRAKPRTWLSSAWGLHAALLAGAALLAASTPYRQSLALTTGFVALLAIGFGLQNATVRILNIPDLTTTVLTTTITQLASESRFGTGQGPSPWRKIASISMIALGAATGTALFRVFPAGVATAGVAGLSAVLVTTVTLVYALAPSPPSPKSSA